jgi:hypothetical protein
LYSGLALVICSWNISPRRVELTSVQAASAERVGRAPTLDADGRLDVVEALVCEPAFAPPQALTAIAHRAAKTARPRSAGIDTGAIVKSVAMLARIRRQGLASIRV